VEISHINPDVPFFISLSGGLSMLPDLPLFRFGYEVIWYECRFWLVEYCELWTGERIVMEMVEIEEAYVNGYTEEK